MEIKVVAMKPFIKLALHVCLWSFLVESALLVANQKTEASDKKVVVASKVDTEGAVLGQMMLKLLDYHGVPVEDKTSFSATSVIRKAMIQGQIHLYPEYTGNGAFFFQMESSPVWKDFQKGYEKVKELDYKKNKLLWLKPAKADNTWAIAVRKDLSQKEKIFSLSDLSAYLKKGGYFKLAASEEFIESPAALPAFQKAYGFTLNSKQILAFSGGNTATTEKAAALNQNGVNACMAYGTDGGLASFDLVVLSDPMQVQPVYAPSAVLTEEMSKRYPKIKPNVEKLFESLTGDLLRKLNEKVALQGVPAPVVAEEYLKKNGFIK